MGAPHVPSLVRPRRHPLLLLTSDFDGGTTFRFLVPEQVVTEWRTTGRVLTEDGEVAGELRIDTSQLVARLSSGLAISTFGVVEWTFEAGARGHISAVMDALGAFSVGLHAECRD